MAASKTPTMGSCEAEDPCSDLVPDQSDPPIQEGQGGTGGGQAVIEPRDTCPPICHPMTTTTASWATIEDAATALNCSTRTIQRRIANGDMTSQRGPDGRTLVRLPEKSDTQSSIVQAVLQQHDTTVEMSRLLSESCSSLQRQIASQSERLLELQATVDRTRRRSWMGWSLALVACATGVVAVVFLSLMRSESDRRASVADAETQDLVTRLVEAEKKLADLRVSLADSDSAARMSQNEARQLADALSDARCERDRILEQLEDAKIEVAGLRSDLMLGQVAFSLVDER